MLIRLVTVLTAVAVVVALAATPASAIPATRGSATITHTPAKWRQIITGWPRR